MRRFIFILVAAAFATACADGDGRITAPAVVTPPVLDFDFPRLAAAEPPEEEPDLPTLSMEETEAFQAAHEQAYIIDARTTIISSPGRIQWVGQHKYKGNVSSIDVRPQLTFEDKPLPANPGRVYKSDPLATGLFYSPLMAVATTYTDRTCGLEASGSSLHHARWETLAPGTMTWAPFEITSFAQAKRWPSCATRTQVGGAGVPGSADRPGVVCTYFITYDLATGVIYAAQLLFCNSAGGDDDRF